MSPNLDFLKNAARFLRRAGWFIAADALVVVLAYRVALPLRFAGIAGEPSSIAPEIIQYWFESWRVSILGIVVVHLFANYLSGIYARLWRFASAPDALVIVQAWILASIPLLALDYVWQSEVRPLPLSTVMLGGFLSFVSFATLRYRWRMFASVVFRVRQALKRRDPLQPVSINTLIVGAGETAQALSWQLQNRRKGGVYQVVGFIDDDVNKQGLRVHGHPVLGNRHLIIDIVLAHNIDLIILAIQAISGKEFREIIAICQSTAAQIKIAPDVLDVLSENARKPIVRDVTVHDLLGRSSTEIDLKSCRSILEGRVVLITGAAGSIGAELCRQVLTFSPSLVIAVDVNESALYGLQVEAKMVGQGDSLQIQLVDVTEQISVQDLFEEYRPQVVFHAAAYKHVPVMESHPHLALRTNVLGTLHVGRAAAKYKAERFVFVSTDKAVHPSSVMGATKQIGESITFGLAAESRTTHFTSVRFGNVLGSRGSVVPVFEQQIDAGGPVTVTDEDMTRFFMTVPEAVKLIIQAAALTKGIDLFMLDMGEQIRISDLAGRMIRLRGLRPNVDIPIVYTGLRPGEKLHEQLLDNNEYREPTPHPQIFRVVNNNRNNPDRGLDVLDQWILDALEMSKENLGRHLLAYTRQL